MRGYCGSWSRTGEIVSEETYLAQRQGMSVLPFSSQAHFSDERVGFSQFYFSSTAAHEPAVPEFNPAADGLLLVGDVRIDNRKELAEMLSIANPISDDELVLAAYRTWGKKCPEHFCGDFAFVIWNQQRSELFACRDHLGVKPFFYSLLGGNFVFASDPAGVVAHPNVSEKISGLAIARYLGEGELFDERLTFYEDVQKLPPATAITVTLAEVEERRYWEPGNTPLLDLGSEQDYVKSLQKLMQQAVADRLPQCGPVGCHLSGGLDSSAIAAVAATQLDGRLEDLKAWSWMRPPKTPEEGEDVEWRYSLQVAEKFGFELNFTEFDAEELGQIFRRNLLLANDSVDLWYEFSVRRSARKSGIQVILSGWGGDQLITNAGSERHIATLFQGKFLSTLRDLKRGASQAERPWRAFCELVYSNILWPLLPAWLRPMSHNLNRSFLGFTEESFREWAESQRKLFPVRFLKTVRESQLTQIRFGTLRSRLESWAVSGARDGIEYRYPLLDKRIVEFALGLPPELYNSRGYGRYLFRRCYSNLLPVEVCWSGAKREPRRALELMSIVSGALKGCITNLQAIASTRILVPKLIESIAALPWVYEELSESSAMKLLACVKSVLVLEGAKMESGPEYLLGHNRSLKDL